MRIFDAFDKKNLLLLALLLLMVAAIGLIWLHYDKELDGIEKRKNEFENKHQLEHEKFLHRPVRFFKDDTPIDYGLQQVDTCVVLQHITVVGESFEINLDKYPAGVYMLYTWDGRAVKLIKN